MVRDSTAEQVGQDWTEMGAILERETGIPREALLRRWEDVLRDPLLRDSPYRVELNRWGTIEMTPVKPHHSRTAKRLADLLEDSLGGDSYTELAIVLPEGLRAPDVAWCSSEFLSQHADDFKPGSLALSSPPEICIEVMSDSNSYGELREKADAYLAAGAREVWIVLTDLRIRVFGTAGERTRTLYDVDLSAWPGG
jgi:Uma2 family endonuclease